MVSARSILEFNVAICIIWSMWDKIVQCANLQTLVSLLSRELQRDVKTLRKVVEQMSTQMDSQAVRERPKIAALLEEVNVIKETMNIQVLG